MTSRQPREMFDGMDANEGGTRQAASFVLICVRLKLTNRIRPLLNGFLWLKPSEMIYTHVQRQPSFISYSAHLPVTEKHFRTVLKVFLT